MKIFIQGIIDMLGLNFEGFFCRVPLGPLFFYKNIHPMKNISDSPRILTKIELKSKAKVAEVPAGKWRYYTLTLLNPIAGLPSIIWTSLCGDSAVATITANKFKVCCTGLLLISSTI
jgi:hypothetical protein